MSSRFPELLEPQLPESSTAPCLGHSTSTPCPGHQGTGGKCPSATDLRCVPCSPAPPPGETSHLPKPAGGGVHAFLRQSGDPGCVLPSSQAVRPPPRGQVEPLQECRSLQPPGRGDKSHPCFLLEEPLTRSQGPGQGVTNAFPFWQQYARVGKLGLRRATQEMLSITRGVL